MNTYHRLAAVTAISGAVVAAAVLHGAGQPGRDAEKQCECIFATPGEMEWRAGPPSLPEGAEFVVLRGDPAQEGPFVLRFRIPAGYHVPPHFHPADENITVISGTFNMGKGEEFDRSESAETYTLAAGSYAMIPAEDRHYAWVEEPTVVQLHGIGPWQITYVDPEDDPRR